MELKPLYTEQNLTDLNRQIKKRIILLCCFLVVALLLVVWLLTVDDHKQNRPALWVTLTVIVAGCVAVFDWDLTIRPLRAYARHLNTALHGGRSHEITVLFDHANEEDSVIDGVLFRDLIFLGEPDKHGDRERMFYWDQELPLPDLQQGQEVTLRYYDRFITAIG